MNFTNINTQQSLLEFSGEYRKLLLLRREQRFTSSALLHAAHGGELLELEDFSLYIIISMMMTKENYKFEPTTIVDITLQLRHNGVFEYRASIYFPYIYVTLFFRVAE